MRAGSWKIRTPSLQEDVIAPWRLFVQTHSPLYSPHQKANSYHFERAKRCSWKGVEEMPVHVGRDGVSAALSSGKTFLTFGGTETFLLFVQEYPLREFAAFEVLDNEKAWKRLQEELLMPIATAASDHNHGLITDCLVWRASPDYVGQLGYPAEDLKRINKEAVSRIKDYLSSWRSKTGASNESFPVILTADLGPRGDGYKSSDITVDAAFEYHISQIRALAETELDLAIAYTMTNVDETVGMVRAAKECGLPMAVSSTVETDGTLPGRTFLSDFIKQVDDATAGYAAFHLVNCTHPEHLEPTLRAAKAKNESWVGRLKGLRANASRKSHEELDNSTELDRGDPANLASQLAALRKSFDFNVVGGCCGTDAEHLSAIAKACTAN
jgi:homocysteine S-methyltransferase